MCVSGLDDDSVGHSFVRLNFSILANESEQLQFTGELSLLLWRDTLLLPPPQLLLPLQQQLAHPNLLLLLPPAVTSIL